MSGKAKDSQFTALFTVLAPLYGCLCLRADVKEFGIMVTLAKDCDFLKGWLLAVNLWGLVHPPSQDVRRYHKKYYLK